MSKINYFRERGLNPEEELNSSRRSFIRYSGAALATTAVFLSGCELIDDYIPPKDPKPGMVDLGSGDTGILNYAYALEQLEAAFYTKVALTGFFNGASYEEIRVLDDVRQHEVAHREFYKAALGKKAIGELTFDFSSVNFGNKESVLATAKTFENLGVAAYNGAGKLIKSADILVVAGKIVSVEARHAEVIMNLINPGGAFADFLDDGLDQAFMPSEVLKAAGSFIVTKIDASNLPTA